jgi:hypothetical protein
MTRTHPHNTHPFFFFSESEIFTITGQAAASVWRLRALETPAPDTDPAG